MAATISATSGPVNGGLCPCCDAAPCTCPPVGLKTAYSVSILAYDDHTNIRWSAFNVTVTGDCTYQWEGFVPGISPVEEFDSGTGEWVVSPSPTVVLTLDQGYPACHWRISLPYLFYSPSYMKFTGQTPEGQYSDGAGVS